MWPNERAALFVVHGIGQQNSFDTLDGFVRTLAEVLKETNENSKLTVWHRLCLWDGQRVNYVSLIKDDDVSTAIDVYEYYWAHEAQRKIVIGEVFDWLVETSEGARKFYEDNIQLVETYELEGVDAFGADRKFKKYWYMKYAGFGFKIARLLTKIRIPNPIAKIAASVLIAAATPSIVGYVGDVALYTATDRKSRHYPVRQAILGGAVNILKNLLLCDDPIYSRVIVVGHSLGSVIGFDALNRINQFMNVKAIDPALNGKLKGFITFGSPLDKIAFFFRQRGRNDQIVKRQILKNLHGFKSREWDPIPEDALQLEHEFDRYLDNMTWLNFWDPKDPLGGNLDFYEVGPGNIKVEMGRSWGEAHITFWAYKPMYRKIVESFLDV